MLYFEKYNSLEHWQAQSESNAVWHSLGPWGFTYNSLYAHIKRETERVENKSKLSLLFFFFLYPVFLAFKIHFLLAFDVVLIKTERARVSVIFFWLLHAMLRPVKNAFKPFLLLWMKKKREEEEEERENKVSTIAKAGRFSASSTS